MSLAERRLLDDGKETGIVQWYHYDHDTKGFVIEDVQDVTALIEQNTRLWNATERHSKYGDLTRIASIPNVVVMELAKQGILSPGGNILDEPRYRRWLNDAENLKWRTRAGKV